MSSGLVHYCKKKWKEGWRAATSLCFKNVYSNEQRRNDKFQRVVAKLSKGRMTAESHKVKTVDGFQLTLHHLVLQEKVYQKRSPYVSTNIENESNSTAKGVVFFLHGLFESSVNWVANGENSMPFMLARQNFDVWLGNNRGNEYTQFVGVTEKEGTENCLDYKKEKEGSRCSWNYISSVLCCAGYTLFEAIKTTIERTVAKGEQPHAHGNYYKRSKQNADDWSFEEMGYKDVPTMLKFVQHYTGGRSIICVGQSQGAVALLLAVSALGKSTLTTTVCEDSNTIDKNLQSPIKDVDYGNIENYNADKVLFGVVGLQLFSPPVFGGALKHTGCCGRILLMGKWSQGAVIILAAARLAGWLVSWLPLSFLCPLAHWLVYHCLQLYRSPINPSACATIFRNSPNGTTSSKNLRHWLHVASTSVPIAPFIKNNRMYELSCTPYILDSVSCPLHIYFGGKDNLVNVERSVEYLRQLYRTERCHIMVFKDWSHLDMGWCSQMHEELYPTVIEKIEKMILQAEVMNTYTRES